MPSRGSKKIIYAAIAANIAIAGCKSVAAAFTKSSAMMAEAVHSTVDTGNELLLLLGMKRSTRRADPLHPYGQGPVLLFIVGRGLHLCAWRRFGHLSRYFAPARADTS
jgi:divalent metal cation (Fe/Co/Zn/Cd) transporter